MVNPYYVKILYLQIHLLAKIYLYPQNQYLALLQAFMNICSVVKNVSCPPCTSPADVEQGNPLLSYFGSHTINRCPFHSLADAMVFTFLCFLLLILPPVWPQA